MRGDSNEPPLAFMNNNLLFSHKDFEHLDC